MSLLTTASLVITPNAGDEGTLYSVIPSDGSGDMSVVRATTATRVNSAGLIESVANNIPRLDYSNGTCPSLLVEPQRTNICRDSNNLSGSNWINQIYNTTLTRIASGGADGNAYDRLVTTGSGNQGRYVQFASLTGTSATFSVYLRGTGIADIAIYNGGQSSLDTITLTSEWKRYETTITSGTTGYIDWSIFSFGGTTVDVSCIQMELGSYSTSYIPTTSASVTRNADVVSKTGISSLIGQTEGTMFLDVDFTEVSDYNGWFMKDVANFDTFAFIQREASGIIAVGYYGSGALQARIETAPSQPIGRYKIGFGYKNNDFVLYINGTQIGTDTSGSVSGLMNFLDAHYSSTGATLQNAIALWKTRLTNTQLAQLTTI
jgi:hypothetical protein